MKYIGAEDYDIDDIDVAYVRFCIYTAFVWKTMRIDEFCIEVNDDWWTTLQWFSMVLTSLCMCITDLTVFRHKKHSKLNDRQQHTFTNPTEYKRAALYWDSLQEYFFFFFRSIHQHSLALSPLVRVESGSLWFGDLQILFVFASVCLRACMYMFSVNFFSFW